MPARTGGAALAAGIEPPRAAMAIASVESRMLVSAYEMNGATEGNRLVQNKKAPCRKQGASGTCCQIVTGSVVKSANGDLTISNCHRSAGCVCRPPRDPRFWL